MESSQVDIPSFHAGHDHRVDVTCPVCGKKKALDLSCRNEVYGKTVSLRCSCGSSFKARILPPEASLPPAQTPPTPIEQPTTTALRDIYASPDNTATVTCPKCGASKTIDLRGKEKLLNKPLTFQCGCGGTFKAVIRHSHAQPEPEARLPVVEAPPAQPGAHDDLPVVEAIPAMEVEPDTPYRSDYRIRLLADLPTDPSKPCKTFHAGKDGCVHVVCPTCGAQRAFSSEEVDAIGKTSTLDCDCGAVFQAKFELRKKFRKYVSLPGTWSCRRTGNAGVMTVKDVSLGGVGFETARDEDLQGGDQLKVRFHLDDSHATLIERPVVVRAIRGRFIGSEFLHIPKHDKELGFYLMP